MDVTEIINITTQSTSRTTLEEIKIMQKTNTLITLYMF